MDNHSPEVRSYNMSQIKSTNTKPEELVRKYLFSKGLRYRKNVKTLPGKPDIVLKKYKTVIFVNGCFWHGHTNCKYFVMPKSNTAYWSKKIKNNIDRDKKVHQKLSDMGWNVITIWECELKKEKREAALKHLYCTILQNLKNKQQFK